MIANLHAPLSAAKSVPRINEISFRCFSYTSLTVDV